MEEDRWLSSVEAGDLLGVSHQTVKDWVQAGRLRGYKLGGRWKFKLSDVLRYIEQAAA